MNRAPGAMIQRNSGQESLTAIRSPVLSGPGLVRRVPVPGEQRADPPDGLLQRERAVRSEQRAGQLDRSAARPGRRRVRLGRDARRDQRHSGRARPSCPPAASRSKPGRTSSIAASSRSRHTGEHDRRRRRRGRDARRRLARQLRSRRTEAESRRWRIARATRRWACNLAATNLEQETAGFIQGFDAYRDEAIAKSNANPEAYRDAYAVRLTGEYERPLGERVQLAVRPYVRHSRMDFLQHFLIGKPLEENGQDSVGVLTALQTSRASTTRSCWRASTWSSPTAS